MTAHAFCFIIAFLQVFRIFYTIRERILTGERKKRHSFLQ